MSRAISAAYLERKLRAITGVQQSNPLPDLESLAGLLTLETDRPEWAFPGGELLLFGGFGVPPAVGEFSYAILENPLGSGVLGILESVKSNPTAAGGGSNVFQILIQTNSLAAPAGGLTDARGLPRDLRNKLGTAGGALHIISGNDANPFGAQPIVQTFVNVAGAAGGAAGELDSFHFPLVLPPDSRVVVQGVIVNVRIDGHFVWRERALEGTLEVK